MSSGYQEPAGGTSSPSTGTAVGSKPVRAWLKVLRNVDIVAEPGYGSTFIPKIKTPIELLSTSLRLHNPAQTFYTNVESAALLANQSIKVPIITATETGNKKDEVVLLKQSQSLENKTFPTYVDVTETAAPANPSAGTLRIYANSTTHEITQRDSSGTEKKISDGTGGGGGGGDVTGGSSLGAGVAVFKDETTGVLRFKSINSGSIVTAVANGDGNTIDLGIATGSIVDSQIGAHTSTKVTITAKGQLNSSILYSDVDNALGSHYVDVTERAAPANPGAGVLRIYANSTTHELTQRDSSGTEKKFSDGSGGAGAPTTSQYLTLATDATLTAERVLTASSRVSITDAGAGSTATLDIVSGSIVDAYIGSHTSTKISITAKGQLNSSIAYVDQANVFSDNDQSFRSARLRVANPANTFFYNWTGAAIAANRTITLPLLTGTDTLVTEAFNQTLTNKTIVAGSNTISGIVDANITAHTSTKVTITAKGQLNSSIVYTDQANAFGDFANTFKDNQLKINNPADTFAYTIVAAAIAANRNLTLPLLTGNDTAVTEAFAQPLTNKTIDFASNTGTNIGDSAIAAHTSTKITITAKGQLNSSIAYQDQANSFGDFNQVFKDNRLLINNPADTFAYTIIGAAIAASRTITLPLLTGNDTAVTEAFSQTLTNKTMSGASNTFSNLGDSAIAAHTSTKITITAKGQLNSQIAYKDENTWLTNAMIANTTIDLQAKGVKGTGTSLQVLRVNSGATALEWATPSAGGTAGETAYSYIIRKSGSDYIAYNTVSKTDQFSNTTAHTTINSVIDAMNTAGGGKAYVKNGLYLFTGPMIPEHFAGLVGESNDKTIFRHTTNTADSSMFRYWQGASSTLLESFSLENISIEINNLNGNGTGESEVAWLSSGTKNCVFRYLKVKSFSAPATGRIGFFIDTANRTNNNENLTVEYCTFEGPCGGQDFLGTGCLIDSNINHNYFKNCTSQAIGVGKSLRTKYNDNTFNITGNAIGLENDCQDNEIKDNVCYITGGIKLSEEGGATINVSRNNTVDGNLIMYGSGGIEAGISINDTIINNILYRTSRNGIRGAFLGAKIDNNHLIDTNFDNNSQTINGSTRTVGGIVCINNATPLPDCDNNIIQNNRLEDTGVTFVDPVSTLSKNGNTGSIILDTSYDNCQLLWNTFCALSPADVLDFGTNTVRLDADDDRIINILTDQSIRLKGSTIRMGPNGRLRMTDTGLTADRDFTYPDSAGEVGVINATQTLINKTMSGASNTFSNLGDSAIAAHTSTKITITAKGQLNSSLLYGDQNNSFGAFYHDITEIAAPANPSAGILRIYANSTSHELTQRDSTGAEKKFSDGSGGGGNLDSLSDVVISSPTTGQVVKYNGTNWINDTDATGGGGAALDDITDVTITTIAANQAIVRNSGNTAYINALIADANITAHTSTKITITAKGQLNSAIVYNDQVNTWGAFAQTFAYDTVRILNSGGTFYSQLRSAATANRTPSLPDNSGTIATNDSTTTFTNKTYDATGTGNSLTNVGDAAIAAHTSTKVTITAKGQLNSNIAYKDQTNTWGAFDQIFPTSRLLIGDSDASHQYIIAGSNLTGANRTITLPLLTGNDTAVMEAFAQPLTNKTIVAGSNTITGIVDANIGSHTSTKITITAKGQLNSAIVYNDQANSMGDFAQTFKDNQLKINNPADTFAYTIVAAAIGANRNLTLPLLAGNDTAVAEAFNQTLTNKTIDFASNTGTNIGDSAIAAHTSTKVTITAKGQLNSSIAYVDQANVFSDNDQSFRSARLRVANPANTFFYNFTAAAIAANRIINLPLLTTTDTMAVLDFAQTFTNKTYNTTDNTLTATSQATGDILANNGSKFVRKARGTGLQVLRTNSGATDIEWASLDSERTGKATANGNASTTLFNIAHGLGATPSYAFISVGQSGSAFIGTQYTVDGTNIAVTFTSAPSSGTDNVIIYWRVVA